MTGKPEVIEHAWLSLICKLGLQSGRVSLGRGILWAIAFLEPNLSFQVDETRPEGHFTVKLRLSVLNC